MKTHELNIPLDKDIVAKGNLSLPGESKSLVIFSHGSGSSRHSPRNKFVADFLNKNGIATLLADLLSVKEDSVYENRFNIDLLTDRLVKITTYVSKLPGLKGLPIGYFGASTGAASALKAAARLGNPVQAVVSRGGRPDLAKEALSEVKVPTLLLVGSMDDGVIELNEKAYEALTGEKQLEIISGATHLFEEPGKLDEVADLAAHWFNKHLHKNSVLT
jgi:putative phosphoribosyl transferase